ncbi:MAG: hypothetical protein NC827_01165 [Candidatus Omnitrophica bacterium]|nr:hypothetical protein [Candidatus Omnitrophota bacterium]MCM8801911.1 hypothetical protein [Candidatus Omnitrophota bacterium]
MPDYLKHYSNVVKAQFVGEIDLKVPLKNDECEKFKKSFYFLRECYKGKKEFKDQKEKIERNKDILENSLR